MSVPHAGQRTKQEQRPEKVQAQRDVIAKRHMIHGTRHGASAGRHRSCRGHMANVCRPCDLVSTKILALPSPRFIFNFFCFVTSTTRDLSKSFCTQLPLITPSGNNFFHQRSYSNDGLGKPCGRRRGGYFEHSGRGRRQSGRSTNILTSIE